MGQPAMRTGVTPAEYLAFERAADQRHEYADGEIFAMSSGTAGHSSVAASIMAELRSALAGRGCRVFTSDMRVKVSATRYVYPDVSALCDERLFEDDTRDTLLNPALVVEVLSDSTEAYDRGDKFAHYRSMPSLTQYVLASQKEPQLEVFTRQADQSWLLRVYRAGERADLSSLGCAIEVDRVYLDVFS